MKLAVSERGFFGEFGGAYIPEMLYPNVRELQERYLEISQEPDFQIELDQNIIKLKLNNSLDQHVLCCLLSICLIMHIGSTLSS